MQTKFSRKELERLNCSEEEILLIMKYQKRFPIVLDNEDNIEKFCINAKDLYKEIVQSEDTSHFSRWIKRAIKNYGFTENVDFSAISPSGRIDNKSLIAQGGDIKSTTYILSVDMSKQLAMIDKKEAGFIARKYFILMENIVTKPHARTLGTTINETVGTTQGIEFVPAIIYTLPNGKDRVYFGPVAR